jgi:tetrahydromethanopterin S-methyltransferase subunit G
MTEEKFTEVIDRLARIETKLDNMESSNKQVKETVQKHETDIQRAKGAIFLLSLYSAITAVAKGFLFTK